MLNRQAHGRRRYWFEGEAEGYKVLDSRSRPELRLPDDPDVPAHRRGQLRTAWAMRTPRLEFRTDKLLTALQWRQKRFHCCITKPPEYVCADGVNTWRVSVIWLCGKHNEIASEDQERISVLVHWSGKYRNIRAEADPELWVGGEASRVAAVAWYNEVVKCKNCKRSVFLKIGTKWGAVLHPCGKCQIENRYGTQTGEEM